MAGITIDFNANVANLNAGVNRATVELQGFQAELAALAGNVSRAFEALGVGISVAGLGALVKATIDEADALDVLNQKSGIAVETLSGLKFGAQLNDTELESVVTAMNRLGREVATNSLEFERLGITSKDPLVALEQAADIFAGIDDQFTKAALANKLFGKSWEELAPLLGGGSKALEELIGRGRKLANIDTELAKASADFNDKLDELNASFNGMRNKYIGPLIPTLNELLGYFFSLGKSSTESAAGVDLLSESFKGVSGAVAFAGYLFDGAGKHLGAFLAQSELIYDFTQKKITKDSFKGLIAGIHAIDDAVEEDLDKSQAKLFDFYDGIKNVDKSVSSSDSQGKKKPTNPNVVNFLKDGAGSDAGGAGSGKAVQEFNQLIEKELQRHNKVIEGSIGEESSLYDFRNKKLEVVFDLGLVSERDYFKQKEQLNAEQLASTKSYLDQEINALQFYQKQRQASIDQQIADLEKIRNSAQTPELKADAQKKIEGLQGDKINVESEAQQQINALLKEKNKLVQDSQIATLQNAAAAQKALGDEANGLININGLLEQKYQALSNIIGIAPQVDPNIQTGGSVTPDALANKNIIFSNEAGNSFSDRPASVGITLDVSQEQQAKVISQVDDLISQIRDQAIKDSAVLLNVDFDQAGAIAKLNEASSAINKSLSDIKPATLKMDVDQAMIINAVNAARDAAQANVKPVVIPVVYQAQNSPANAAASSDTVAQNLSDAALAAGGR